ncbi:MAG: DMT family transporter [Pyramidobacter sp.]|nr:DMT family transporter [Pyramidobacter sp.]
MNKQYFYALLSVVCWSTMTPVSKTLLGSLSGFEVQLWRAGTAAVSLLLIIAVRGQVRELLSLVRREGLRLAGYGFVGFFLYTTLHLFSLGVLSGQLTSVVNYLWPIFTVCLSSLILREPFSAGDVWALALSFAGVAVASLGAGAGGVLGFMQLLGLLATIVAALGYAWFSVVNKRLGEDQTLCMFVYNFTSAVCVLPLALHAGLGPYVPAQCAGLTWLGVSGGALGSLFWAMALNCGDAAKVANLAYATPALSVFICGTVLGEGLHFSSFAGLGLILAGFFVQKRFEQRKRL